ncbi:hypothetical protein TNCV_2164581 [Trichonephila clavipes]|nr:hypothetical protein TNCV_2164581 [Trichonephila clavipes]
MTSEDVSRNVQENSGLPPEYRSARQPGFNGWDVISFGTGSLCLARKTLTAQLYIDEIPRLSFPRHLDLHFNMKMPDKRRYAL